MGDETTLTIRKDTLWKYSTFLLLTLLIVGGFVFFQGGNNNPATGNVIANNPQPTIPSQPSQVTASADDDPILGDKKASVFGISVGALSFLPYDGFELSIASIGILSFTIVIITKNMCLCKLKYLNVRGEVLNKWK